jgi:hypothetical protein
MALKKTECLNSKPAIANGNATRMKCEMRYGSYRWVASRFIRRVHFSTALPTPATVGIRRGRAGRAAESAGHDLTETGGDVLTSRLLAPGGREHATRHYATEEEMGELGLVESGVPSSVPGRTIPRRRALGRGNHQARKQPAQKTLSSHGSLLLPPSAPTVSHSRFLPRGRLRSVRHARSNRSLALLAKPHSAHPPKPDPPNRSSRWRWRRRRTRGGRRARPAAA